MVQKVSANPGSIGILGYSFLEENAGKVRGIPLGGVAPTAETIASFDYPGARPLYVYVKGDHLSAIPGLREYIAEFAKGWAPGAYLARHGLIPSPADKLEAQNAIATALTPLDGTGLK
jgi:phosphate transport system substrate-binding protein